MNELLIAIEWRARWQRRIAAWQTFYGSTVGYADRTVTTILADCEENRRKFAHGAI